MTNVSVYEPNQITFNANVEILGTDEWVAEGIARGTDLVSIISMWDQGVTCLRMKLRRKLNIITMANNLHHLSLHRSAAWLDPTWKR